MRFDSVIDFDSGIRTQNVYLHTLQIQTHCLRLLRRPEHIADMRFNSAIAMTVNLHSVTNCISYCSVSS